MTWGTLRCEIAFSDPPITDSPTWTIVTDDLEAVSVGRGRSNELELVPPASTTIELDNTEGDYDPDNSAGPHFGDIGPLKQVRLSAEDSGATRRVFFRGFIEPKGWAWSYPQGRDAIATIQCFDLLGVLAQFSVPRVGLAWKPTVLATLPEVFYRLGEGSGTTAVDSSTNGHDGTYAGTPSFGETHDLGSDNDTAVQFGTSGSPDARIAVPSAGFDPGAGSWTIACWLWPWSVNEQTVFHGVDASANAIRVGICEQTSSGRGNLFINIDGTNFGSDDVSAIFPIRTNTWQLCWWSYDATTGIAKMGVNVVAREFLSPDDFEFTQAMTAYSGGTFTAAAHFGALEFAGAINDLESIADEAIFWHEAIDINLARTIERSAEGAGATDVETFFFGGDLTGTRIRRVLAMLGIPAVWQDIDDGLTLLQATTFTGVGTALEYINQIVETEGGTFYVTRDGTLTFDDRHAEFRETRQTTSQATYSDTGTNVDYDHIGYDHDTEVWNRAVIGVQGVQIAAEFVRADGTIVVIRPTTTYEWADVDSIEANTEQTYERSGLLFQNDPDAFARAQWIVQQYKDPASAPVELTIKATDDDTMLDEALLRELRDRVTVTFLPPRGGTAITKQVHIEQIRHEIPVEAAPNEWTTSYVLSLADRAGVDADDWLELDHATKGLLDGTRRLAP